LKKLSKGLKQHPNKDSEAAVVILITPTIFDLELFMVKRSQSIGDPWSGDIAFPGGKRISEDKTLLETVIREVREETKINLNDNEVLGYLDHVHSWVKPEMTIQPIVYVFSEKPKFELNFELTKAFWAPIEELVKTKQQLKIKGWYSPAYNYKNEIIWGLTYRMIENIFEIIST
jgi:8-oxo-dGTP pyrophosphatase MutT (NUDIX family)